MISLNEFLAAVEEISAENPRYRKGGSGFDGSCDCIGLIIGALQRCGGKWSGIHGSNWTARNATDGLKRIVSNSDLEIGDLVYKAKAPGEKGYDLPNRYKGDKDQNDYYHVGVVMSVYPLRIRHMTTPTMKIDIKLGAWTHHGWCSLVEREKWNHAEGETGISIARLHDCLDVIEKQLDFIYQMTGSPLPATDGSLLPALKRGQLHMGSVTRTESADTSPKRGRLQMGSEPQIKDLDASSGGRG